MASPFMVDVINILSSSKGNCIVYILGALVNVITMQAIEWSTLGI
jgi:hypothetical protein